jgi:hypothetical protein
MGVMIIWGKCAAVRRTERLTGALMAARKSHAAATATTAKGGLVVLGVTQHTRTHLARARWYAAGWRGS